MKTSRDRPKSAPYLMFKNSKRTSIKVPKYSLLQNPIFLKSHNVEKTESGPSGFFNIHYAAKFQKIEGDPLENFFSQKKPHNAEKKNRKGGPVSLARYCMLCGNEKPFRFSSLGHQVQFKFLYNFW